ncbi:MAG: FtsW/RodA/SpoVE family cell cycle protein [Oscillospiraceae bacterium]|nr:FtsW/RodA/SpoVE family cell cycle protein [Oscillospiraceae bacterium]
MRKFFETVYRYIRESDMFLLALCVISTVYGIVLISSVGGGADRRIITVQIMSLVMGVVIYVLLSLIDIDIIADKSKLLVILSAALICTLFIWGEAGDTGNKAWLRFGGIGVQPAEIVKIPFSIVTAHMITEFKSRRTLNSPLSVLQIVAVFALLFGLILVSSGDLGSALVYVFILLAVMFLGGIKLRWFLLGAAALAAAGPFIWSELLTDRQRDRIKAPFDPSIDPTGRGITWQPSQSKLAIASGGFTGKGLHNGPLTQSGTIPHQQTDFIFSAAGEELGFVGCFLIILLLTAIIVRCIYVGIRSNNTLGLLVCAGLTAMLVFHTLENIGMCLGLAPVIGLTLPFFSSGGSSIITAFAAMGIVSGIKMRPKPLRFRTT